MEMQLKLKELLSELHLFLKEKIKALGIFQKIVEEFKVKK
jgi:hypothetical protein